MSEEVLDHRLLFDQMPVVRFLVKKHDDVFYCSAVNELGLSFFCKDKEGVVGQSLGKLFDEIDFVHIRQSLEVSWKKKVVVTIPNLPESMEGLKLSGFWINPVCEDGEVVCLDVIGQPGATDKAVIERERDDALSLLTAIFDASDIGILVFDRQRKIIKINNGFERIYGWASNQVIGKDFLEFVTDDERDIGAKNYKEFLKDKKNHSGEVKVFCKDGTIANALFTTASLSLSHDRRFQVTTLVNITKRKQMELSLRVAKDQADAANNAKSVFLANMSHELRTPLNAIIGFSEMMVAEAFGPIGDVKYKEYLSDVHLSARHLLEIINEVLDMSKIEAGKIELDEQEIDLNKLIQTLIRLMKAGNLHEDLSIKENYSNNLPQLYADPRLIRQVLMNLITNSVKYSINGGEIKVSTQVSGKDEVEIIVSDEGVGIPEDRIKDALEPFGQIHDPHVNEEPYQGTGLGLPLAKAMVELHGGVFSLKSKENEGTTVKISFSKSRTRHH